MPDFLIEPNFYFKLYNLKKEEDADLERYSDSEFTEVKDHNEALQEKQSH
jgi:hypothetical protein